MNKKGKALSTVITFLILLIVFIITIWIFRDKVYAGMEKYGFIEKSIETQIEEIVKKPVSEITKEDIEKAAETQEGAEAMFEKLDLLEKDPLELSEEDLENAKILDESIDATKRLCENIFAKANTETKPEKKIKYYQKFIEVCPKDERVKGAHFSIADLYCKIGEYSRAISKYNSLIAEYPKEEEKINREIDGCKNEEKIEEIKKEYRAAVKYIQGDEEERNIAIGKFDFVITKFRQILADEKSKELHKHARNYIAASLYWKDYPKKDNCQGLYAKIFSNYDNKNIVFPLELYGKKGPVASWAYYDKGECYKKFGREYEEQKENAFRNLVIKYPKSDVVRKLKPECAGKEKNVCNSENKWLDIGKTGLKDYRCFYYGREKTCVSCDKILPNTGCKYNYNDPETCKADPCALARSGYECRWIRGFPPWHCEEKEI